VDGNSNVWVACDSSVMHFAPNPANPSQHVLIGSINHFGADAFSYTHGVAVDMNGKIWGPDKNRNAAWRIDPAGGPVINGSHVGAVDMRVDLGSGAGPYNYSDMTGFVLLSETSPSGVWDRVQDSGHAGASWTISWTGNTPAGTAIKAEVRMANQLGGLYSQPFQSITANPQPNCGSGRYIEARFTLSLDKTVTTTSPTLTDVTLTHSP
jgi:hypothetical protein